MASCPRGGTTPRHVLREVPSRTGPQFSRAVTCSSTQSELAALLAHVSTPSLGFPGITSKSKAKENKTHWPSDPCLRVCFWGNAPYNDRWRLSTKIELAFATYFVSACIFFIHLLKNIYIYFFYLFQGGVTEALIQTMDTLKRKLHVLTPCTCRTLWPQVGFFNVETHRGRSGRASPWEGTAQSADTGERSWSTASISS